MNLSGPLYALVAFGIYATHDVIIKFLGGSYSPFQLIFFSTLFSFPLVTFMLMRDATSGNLRPVHPWWTAIRTVLASITGFSAFYAFSVLPLAQTYVLLFATPLLITLLSIPMLGERVGLHRLGAVLAGLIGVLVVLQPGATDLTLGHAAGVTSAVCNAFASVIVRKIGRDERPVVLMLYPMAANFVLMGVLLAFVYKPMPVEHVGGLAVISALGFIAGLVLISAYKNGDAAIVAPMQYSQIIWASLFGYFIFGESLERATVIGAGIIILSGLYIVFREARLGAKSQTPVIRTRSRGSTAASFRISPILRRSTTREPAE
ncbi:DMT family transporter [Maritimibacter sp. UBA3975]|uniref:DMT family transporter n=1 Tax=Maritimibacter sp. UBA3975 TaxID=1946833 RepID=UPI000C09AC6E|nr:DMT family transporter [Maritimibacter sp. UBA3975]MAM63362.1 EamA family transporter [Maritimibacter sp.]|tara:strand:- start:115094 stop:116050 length:957 start_codon:yes stop_codon:yes gene_type:complete